MPRLSLLAWLLLLGLVSSASAGDKLPKPFVTGLKLPESVAVGFDGRVYITEIGEFGKDGDGRVLVVGKDGKAVPFAEGLDDPKGIIPWMKSLFVADNKRVLRIDEKGKVHVFAAEATFPIPPRFLNDIAVDEHGFLYVSDSGDRKGGAGAVFRIDPKGKVTLVTDTKRIPGLKIPNGLTMDGKSFLLLLDAGAGELLRVKIADGTAVKVADGFGHGDGLVWDKFGRLFVSDWTGGKVFGIPRPGEAPVLIASGFESAADMCLDATGKFLLVPDMKAGTVTKIPTTIPGFEVDETPLPVKTAIAFPDLKWQGWQGERDDGKLDPLRPLILTHAGDGSNRNFVAIQQGTIHVFPNDAKATQTKLFLNIRDRVTYNDKQNEEGLLGLAFHPQYKKNGEFFVFYTPKKSKLTNVVSRFKVSKDNPDQADPDSEEVLLTVKRPFWNHDGGTICFGPDGFLYVALGDGGAADDPHRNGQNLKTMLGKILRIDVDRKDEGKGYAIPKDNPFVGRDDAIPETWAYGLRNVWRMAFDRETGKLWAADVGQNLYEEINVIVKGGNYGWSVRESLHPFSVIGVGPRKDIIDPIWEYHHDLGKSITGGHVYRGKEIPELQGAYVYGDYISTKIWGLRYDDAKKRVVANQPIADQNAAILSFGEDERGEIYLLTTSVGNAAVLKFVKAAPTAK